MKKVRVYKLFESGTPKFGLGLLFFIEEESRTPTFKILVRTLGPTQKQHLWQGKPDDWLLKMKPEYWSDLDQVKSILHSCETSSWVRQHNVGSLYSDKRANTRNGTTEGCQVCEKQTQEYLQCIRHAEHHELAKSTRQEERCQVVFDVQGRQESGCHHERQALSSNQEKNPALSHQSLPDTELQNRSKKELILPKDSSWLECTSSRHHWSRVPGCFQSPGDNSDPLTNAWKIF